MEELRSTPKFVKTDNSHWRAKDEAGLLRLRRADEVSTVVIFGVQSSISLVSGLWEVQIRVYMVFGGSW